MDDADWFLKATDESYVIMENLRTLVHPYPADIPIFFGRKMVEPINQKPYMNGSSYVLSKQALRRFVEDGITDPDMCRIGSDGEEDVELGKCMANLQVIAGDSRDENGRDRFFPWYTPEDLMKQDGLRYNKHSYYTTKEVIIGQV